MRGGGAVRSHWSWQGAGWSAGQREGTRLDGERLVGPGSWRVQVEVGDWDRGVLSLNHAPFRAGDAVAARVRVRSADAWSAWLPWGRYGSGGQLPASTTTKLEDVAVDVDVLQVEVPADAVELELTFEDLLAHLEAQEVARFKLPERLEVIDEFPLSPFGKVSKKTLVEMITEKLETGA